MKRSKILYLLMVMIFAFNICASSVISLAAGLPTLSAVVNESGYKSETEKEQGDTFTVTFNLEDPSLLTNGVSGVYYELVYNADVFEPAYRVENAGTQNEKTVLDLVTPMEFFPIVNETEGKTSIAIIFLEKAVNDTAVATLEFTVSDTAPDGTYYIKVQQDGIDGAVASYEEDEEDEIVINAKNLKVIIGEAKAWSEAPIKPVVESATSTTITLEEIVPTENDKEFGVLPTVEYGIDYDRDGTVDKWQTSTEFTGLTPDTTYDFYARYAADDENGIDVGPMSEKEEGKTERDGLAAPANAAVAPETYYENSTVTWEGVDDDADSYTVEVIILPIEDYFDGTDFDSKLSDPDWLGAQTGWEAVGTTTEESYTDYAPEKEGIYIYRVKATDNGGIGDSAWTYTNPDIPAKADREAPEPTIERVTDTTVTLDEVVSPDNDTTVYYGCDVDRNGTIDDDEWQTSPEFTGLEDNTEYDFAIKFVDEESGDEAVSSIVSETTVPTPVIESVTDTTITIEEVTDVADGKDIYYGVDRNGDGDFDDLGEWQTGEDANIFDELDPNTEYDVAIKYVDQDTDFDAESVPVSTITAPTPVIEEVTDSKIVIEEVEDVPDGVDVYYGVDKDGNGVIDDDEWQTSPEFDGLTPGTDYDVSIKYVDEETDETISQSEPITVTTAPAPSFDEITDTEITLDEIENVPDGKDVYYGVDIDKNGTIDDDEWQTSPEFTELEPNTEYDAAVKFVDQETGEESVSETITATTAPTPSADATDTTITITPVEDVPDGVDVYYGVDVDKNGTIDDDEWKTGDNANVFDGLTPNTDYDVSIKYVDEETGNESISNPVNVTTDKSGREVPIPEAEEIGENYINLKEVLAPDDDTTVYYGCDVDKNGTIDDDEWQISPEFTGLTPNTEYDFAIKYSETDVYEEAISDTAKITTNMTALSAPESPDVDNQTYHSKSNIHWSPVSDADEYVVEVLVLPINDDNFTGELIVEVDGERKNSSDIHNHDKFSDDLKNPEWLASQTGWKAVGTTSGTAYTTYEPETAGIYIYRVKAKGDGYNDSTWTYTNPDIPDKAVRQPPTITASSKTPESITLKKDADVKYAIGDGEFGTTTKFTGLKPDTSYEFKAYYPETDTYLASDVATATIKTTKKSSGGGGGGGGGGSWTEEPNIGGVDLDSVINNNTIKNDKPAPGTNGLHDPYIKGYEDGSVRPNGNITRAELAMIFYRLSKNLDKEDDGAKNKFSDVDVSFWASTAINYCASQGWVVGYPDGTYRADGNLTRAEFVTALLRAAHMLNNSNTETPFTDVDGHWAEAKIAVAYEAECIEGYEDGSFRPDGAITRAEVMTVMNDIIGRAPEKNDIIDIVGGEQYYTDLTEDFWGYADVMEASVGHMFVMGDKYEDWLQIYGRYTAY